MDADLELQIVASIKEALSFTFIGSTIGTILYGITVLQTYVYFRRYWGDKTWIKSLVAVLFILDTTLTVLILQGAYTWFVVDFRAPTSRFMENLVEFPVHHGISLVINCATQCFFGQKLWYFGGSVNRYLVGAIFLLSIAALSTGQGKILLTRKAHDLYLRSLHQALTAFLLLNLDSIYVVADRRVGILSGVNISLSVACDILITSGLCFYLRDGRSTGLTRTRRLIDRLMLYVVQRGILTAVCQTSHMILTLASPNHYYSLIPAYIEAKLYFNSLLASLNVRDSLRNGAMSEEHESLFLVAMPQSATSIGNRRPCGNDSGAVTTNVTNLGGIACPDTKNRITFHDSASS
ncbi:hypothetical protein C8Q74DRAFT_1283139 [Fomes fomentarius]|nr:hypothetical protein C8Q74DRAFT_1283139 [Fomes fomentarius]